MPNWCSNRLVITATKKSELAKVLKLAVASGKNGKDLNCEGIVPTPEDLLKNDWQNNPEISKKNVEKHGYSGWYDFHIAKWGTKWTPQISHITQDDKEATLYFDSAWSPPTGIVEALAQKFPKCSFTLEFCEPGMGFAGVTSFAGGELMQDSTYEGDDEYQNIAESFGLWYDEEAEDEENDEEAEEKVEDKDKEKPKKEPKESKPKIRRNWLLKPTPEEKKNFAQNYLD